MPVRFSRTKSLGELKLSQLLVRLETELASLQDEVERSVVIARIAIAMARAGRFDDARSAVKSLRDRFGRGEDGRVTVWIMLAEGLICHYEELSPAAKDRIARAQLLGMAMNYGPAVALISAWKAHIEFERSEFNSMIDSIGLALKSCSPSDHDAQTRLSMVLANAFSICNEVELARAWFQKGREHAIRIGDQASVEALLYNRVAFSLAWLRAWSCGSKVESTQLARVHGELQSAKNLQDLTGISALSNHVRLLEARLLILEEQYGSAIELFENIRGATPFASHNFDQSFIDLEIDYCRSRMSGYLESDAFAGQNELSRFDHLDIDERIVAVWMTKQIAEKRGQTELLAVLQQQFEALWVKYTQERQSLGKSLRALVAA